MSLNNPPPLPPRHDVSLVACFKHPQDNIDSLFRDWSSRNCVQNGTLLCNELQFAVRNFLDRRLPTAVGETAVQVLHNDLTTQARKIISRIDPVVRLRLMNRAIGDISSWLEEFRASTLWSPEEEESQLANQAFYIVACCVVKTDPLSSFARENARRCSFVDVAEMGANRILKDMIRELRNYLEEQSQVTAEDNVQDNLYENLVMADGAGNTALLFAAENKHFETMDILLQCEPRLADHLPSTNVILEKDNDEGFKKIIQYRRDLVSSGMLSRAIQCGLGTPIEQRSYKIIASLLQEDPSLVDDATAKLIVEIDDPEIWQTVKGNCDVCFARPTCTILHDAVYNRRVDIVEYVIKKAPALSIALRKDYYTAPPPDAQANARKETHYALWYNSEEHSKKDPRVREINDKLDNPGVASYSTEDRQELERLSREAKDIRQKIRDWIVPAVIRSAEPFTIRRIFKQSNTNNICLPLSSFNTSAHDFMLYVTRLIEKSGEKNQSLPEQYPHREVTRPTNGVIHRNQLQSNVPQQNVRNNRSNPAKLKAVKFEKVLRYADFPDLNSTFPCTLDDYRMDYDEVHSVLKWLKENKVEEIVEVRVSDRLHMPHEDAAVKYCVQEFKVRTLNWRKLDLCLADLDPDGTLKSLHLYTSGNLAVIHNWLGRKDKGGLIHLRNLEDLYIHVVQDVLSDKRANELEKLCTKEFGKLKRECGWKEEVKVYKEHWRKQKVEERAKDLKEIVELSFPDLAPFVEKYKTEHRQCDRVPGQSRRSKVCLIDSGVVVVENNATEKLHIGAQIEDGQSFVYEDSSESPWWHASVPHGTQMASLVCSIDPCCELYVAKVGDDIGLYGDLRNAPVTPDRVTEAVEWAISREVDIIVLCLVTTRETKDLKKAFEMAKEKNIVVICSTSDAGRNWRDTWPTKYAHHKDKSGFDNIIGIGACDKEGFRLEYTQDTDFPFLFLGKDVYVGPIPFVKSEDMVSGSSVATAIAAGVASLTLSCCRLANNDAVLKGPGKHETVIKKFGDMSISSRDRDGPRYVSLQRFVSEPSAMLFEKPFINSSNFSNALGGEFGPNGPLGEKRIAN